MRSAPSPTAAVPEDVALHGAVDVARCESTQSVLSRWPSGCADVLTDQERVRLDALVDDRDRDDVRAAHLLVRECVAELVGTDPARVRLGHHCERCGSVAHGRPSVDRSDVHVSLSHTRGRVAAVASYRPVAVDVELTRHVASNRAGLSTVLTTAERTLLARSVAPDVLGARLWVTKEALVKLGLARLDQLDVVDVTQVVLAPGPVTLTGSPATLHVCGAPGYAWCRAWLA